MSCILTWTGGPVANPDQRSGMSQLWFDVVVNENPQFPTTITEHAVEKGADISDNVRVGLKSLTLEVFVSNEPVNNINQWGSGAQSNLGAMQTPDTLQTDPTRPASLTAKEWFNLPIGIPLAGPLMAALDLNEQDVPFTASIGMPATKGQQINPRVLQFTGFSFDAVQATHDLLDQLRSSVQLITVVGTKASYDNMVIERFDMARSADTGTGATFTIELKEIRLVTTKIVKAPVTTKPRANTPVSKGTQAPAPAAPQQTKSLLAVTADTFAPASPPNPTSVPGP